MFVSTNKKNADFRRILPKLNLSIPVFYPEMIDRSTPLKMFGRLSELPISTDKTIVEKMKFFGHNTCFLVNHMCKQNPTKIARLFVNIFALENNLSKYVVDIIIFKLV